VNFLALRMLTGLIFSIAFASFLISQQASIFIGLMSRTTSQVIDVVDADIWDGKFRQVILMGLDDATLVGAPRTMLLWQLNGLRRPDAIVVDRAVTSSHPSSVFS
jgi:putative ABC transport system permease protein